MHKVPSSNASPTKKEEKKKLNDSCRTPRIMG
jgi:hypothetical protein